MLLLTAMPTMAEHVTPETARKVATTFLTNNGAKAAQLTDLSKAAGFPNLYIFTAEQGFVVMSADDCVQPILGYSLTGKFVTDEMPENVSSWLQGYNEGIRHAIINKTRATDEVAEQWRLLVNGNSKAALATPVVDALIQTQWNQGSPYNNLCPKIGTTTTVTGCVATAMAQVMKFWEHPTTGTSSHSYTWNSQTLSADFGATTYDWANMTNAYNSSSNDTQKAAVATLMHHCGVSVEMDYGTSSSGGSAASTYDVMSALQTYFSYAPNMQYKSKDDYEDEVWITMLKNELNDGRPMQYRGSDAGGQGGHSFVCDGYDSDDKFHFNWGWGGYCDGFYALDDMEPGTGGIGAGNGVYTVGQSAIFGIEPISSLAAPTLSATTAEGCINLTWNAISEAESYDVYRDNVKIATNVSGLTYTDNDISSGVYYEYHVRAVNSETKSNPSNLVTAMTIFRDLRPSNLTATANGNNVNLEWTGYAGGESVELHYGVTTNNMGYNAGNEGTYWGQRYPTTVLENLFGMELNKVSVYLYYAGDYSCYVFNGSISNEDKIHESSYTKAQNGMVWVDITPNANLNIDHTKDLWIVFYYNNQEGTYPAICGDYDGDGASDAKYISTSLEDLPTNWIDEDLSWLFKTYLTDGTYTYNLYQDGVKIAENHSNTTYNASLNNNAANLFTVKTNYYGGESAASNRAGLAFGTASLGTLELGANDKMTVTAGSTLNVSGTMSNGNAANLVLEDGAQLINNSVNVKATVKKSIAPYTADDNGWYFIASPVTESITPSVDNGLIANNYDLYLFDQSEDKEWKNIRTGAFSTIDHKTGYLYANNTNTTLSFEGTLAATAAPTNLAYDGNANLKGFNLIGNPYPCNASVDKDFYVIDGNSIAMLASNAREIAPCEGIFVKATGTGQSATFTKAGSAKSSKPNDCFDIVVTQDKDIIDRARVRFGEGTSMEKFSLDSDNTQISLWQEGQDFAVAYVNGETEMPLNFKATKNRTYTLGIESNSLDLDYLHLIDNMTGDDIDLLAMPSYSFEAKTMDYASRFRLVFNANKDNASTESETFAYIQNGEIVITADAFDASLQVVDMMGRVVVCRDALRASAISTSGTPAGVYVLRLITADGVKTQKIVIE